MCLVHATNMMLGDGLISADDMLNHITKMDETWRKETNGARFLTSLYQTGTGNFCTNLMNHWLHINPPGGRTFHLAAAGTIKGDREKTTILDSLPANTTAFQLHWDEPFGHAICIKQHAGAWWWLDSMHPSRLMSEDDWFNMTGTLYVPVDGPDPNLAKGEQDLAAAQECFDRATAGLPQLTRGPQPGLGHGEYVASGDTPPPGRNPDRPQDRTNTGSLMDTDRPPPARQ
jgi:hypothetical protein